MLEFLPRLLQIDQNSLILVVLLCTWAVFIVRGALPHPLLGVLVLPAFILATLAANLLLREFDLQPTSDKVVNLAFASGTGIITAFGLLAALCWLVSSLRPR